MKNIILIPLFFFIGCTLDMGDPKVDTLEVVVPSVEVCLNFFGVPELDGLGNEEICWAMGTMAEKYIEGFSDRFECHYNHDTGWCGCFAKFELEEEELSTP